MLRRLAPFGLLILALLTACGKGAAPTQAVPKQPSDPRSAATATIPPALPSPIPAVPVAIGTSGPGGAASNSAGVSATSGPSSYSVKSGDTLGAIASKLGVSLTALEGANPDVNPAALSIGQQLNVPAPATQAANPPAGGSATTPAAGATITTPGILGTRTPTALASARAAASAARTSVTGPQTYTVKSGDTACKIATAHQVSLQELSEANGTSISGLAALKIGQQLKIPAATGSLPGC